MAKDKTKAKRTKNNSSKDKRINRDSFVTYTGHVLTPKEAKFIDNYVETGNQRQAVIEAGYTTQAPGQYANTLLRKSYITEEINHRLEMHKKDSIAEADEILQYFTSVMRGEITDQFGLEAPLGERTKAAQELAKRKIDIPNRLAGKDTEPTIKIKLVRE